MLCSLQIWLKVREIACLASSKFVQFFKKIMFIYLRERDREITSRGRGRGRKSSRLPAELRAWCGAWSQGSEIMTQVKRKTLNWLSYPGSLPHFLKKFAQFLLKGHYLYFIWWKTKLPSTQKLNTIIVLQYILLYNSNEKLVWNKSF